MQRYTFYYILGYFLRKNNQLCEKIIFFAMIKPIYINENNEQL